GGRSRAGRSHAQRRGCAARKHNLGRFKIGRGHRRCAALDQVTSSSRTQDRRASAMYIVEFHNLKPNEEVNEALTEHRSHLAKSVELGVIGGGGPKVPRRGGMIVVADVPPDRLDAMLAEDPFLRRGSARCVVTEFRSNFLSPALLYA